MAELGVRELKARASEILRQVRDRRARFTVTYRGRPVAMLSPLSEPAHEGETGAQDAWEALVTTGQAISNRWRCPLSSAELLSEMRR